MDRFMPKTLPFTKKKLPVRVILSYGFDYGIIVFLAAVYAAIDVIVTPFNQPFALQNYTIQYPFAVKERIPIPLALVISVIGPMIVISLYTLVLDGIFSHRRKSSGAGWSEIYRIKDRLWELNCGILGLFLAEGAAFVITGSLKNLCGKPRPDLIARCQPVAGSTDPPVFGLSTRTICTQTDEAIMADGFRSFPSGHSSSAFAGLFYLSLYLAGKLHVLDNRGEVWRTFIVLIPTLAAACVAMSRIMDARHHPFDVLFGSAMGILVAWASYRQYFPPVSETWRKGRAYPIRTWGTETKQPPFPSENDMVQRDPNMEPFRTPGGTAIADPSAASSSPRDGLEGQNPEYNNNIFRDQIHRSQRQRQQQSGPAHLDGAGADSQNPYAMRTSLNGASYTSPRRQDREDDWSATTSSDGTEDVYRGGSVGGDAEGFEMQSSRHQPHTSGTSMATRYPEARNAPLPVPAHHQQRTNHPPPAAHPHSRPDMDAEADTDANAVRDEDNDRTPTAYPASNRQADPAWSPLEAYSGGRTLA